MSEELYHANPSCRYPLSALPLPAWCQPPAGPKADLPRVVLLGDSIRLGYAPLVAKKLEGKAVVISPKANGGDSSNTLKHLAEWAIKEKPAVIHFNCGLHDLKRSKNGKTFQVELPDYEENLKEIVARLRKDTSASLVFASTTPIHDQRHASRKGTFDRFEADVRRYNDTATRVMLDAGVPVHDLHWVVEQGGVETMLGNDGTHYTPAGNERLAEAVADCVLRQLIIRNYKPLPAPPAGPQAADNYRKAERERDALVPTALSQDQGAGVPHSAIGPGEWKQQRPEVLRKVVESLGDLPPRPSPMQGRG